MGLGSSIRIALVRFCSIFYFRKRSKVIFYHDIHSDKQFTEMSTSIDLFKKHIRIIRNSGYDIVANITKPTGQIKICFDDAFLGLYKNIEFIKESNIAVQLFVISSFIGKKNHIDKSQLLELNNTGLVNIESHTHTHKILNKISDNEVKYELAESKKVLENLLTKEVNSICYPEGKFNNSVIDKSKATGYTKQYTSVPGFYYNEFFLNVKNRSLVQFADEKEFKAILKGGDHILAIWYKLKHFIK